MLLLGTKAEVGAWRWESDVSYMVRFFFHRFGGQTYTQKKNGSPISQQQSNTYLEQYIPYCLAELNVHRIEALQHQVQIATPIQGRIVGFPLARWIS